MSLTDVLADRDSSLSLFLKARFPAIGDLADRIGTQAGSRAIPAIGEHRKTIPWRTIGTAVDYRLRLSFTPDAIPKPPGGKNRNRASTNVITAGVHSALAASKDAGSNPGYGKIARLGQELISRFHIIAEEISPYDPAVPVSLGGRTERQLCTLCYAGAWYDGLFRNGDINDERHRELRYAASSSDDLDGMLTAIPEIAVTNMAALIRHAGTSDLATLRERFPGGRTCISGPTFPGSSDVGGADADLIADRLLLEIKTHARPASTAQDALRQLLGYLLLDYDDRYKLKRAGIYYARHACLLQWEIPELLKALGCPHGIAGLRRECASVLRSSSRYGSAS